MAKHKKPRKGPSDFDTAEEVEALIAERLASMPPSKYLKQPVSGEVEVRRRGREVSSMVRANKSLKTDGRGK